MHSRVVPIHEQSDTSCSIASLRDCASKMVARRSLRLSFSFGCADQMAWHGMAWHALWLDRMGKHVFYCVSGQRMGGWTEDGNKERRQGRGPSGGIEAPIYYFSSTLSLVVGEVPSSWMTQSIVSELTNYSRFEVLFRILYPISKTKNIQFQKGLTAALRITWM